MIKGAPKPKKAQTRLGLSLVESWCEPLLVYVCVDSLKDEVILLRHNECLQRLVTGLSAESTESDYSSHSNILATVLSEARDG